MRHAGTNAGPDGTILANGGLVLNVSAMASTVKEPGARACRAIDPIDWPEGSMSLKSWHAPSPGDGGRRIL